MMINEELFQGFYRHCLELWNGLVQVDVLSASQQHQPEREDKLLISCLFSHAVFEQ